MQSFLQELKTCAADCGLSEQNFLRAIKLTRLQVPTLQNFRAEQALELITQDLEQQVLDKEREILVEQSIKQ